MLDLYNKTRYVLFSQPKITKFVPNTYLPNGKTIELIFLLLFSCPAI